MGFNRRAARQTVSDLSELEVCRCPSSHIHGPNGCESEITRFSCIRNGHKHSEEQCVFKMPCRCRFKIEVKEKKVKIEA